MTDQLPAPFVPAEVDLRDFAFMPLDVSRLRDSDLASDETPEACWAAVLLWCASWHQIPAASIPDSDQWQAKQCGYVAQGRIAPAWRKVKTGALRGWVKCDDGRLYHPVVAEKALDAWKSKLAQRHRAECARIKKHNQRHGTSVPYPELEAWIAAGCPSGQLPVVPGDAAELSQGQARSVPGETASKGQGEGQGQGLVEEKTSSSSSAGPTPGDGEGSGKGARTPTIPCPYREIVGAYHDALPTLPKVKVFDGKAWEARCKAMREFWGWILSSKRADGSRRAETGDQAMGWVREYFALAATNDFILGRTPRSDAHRNWRCDIDYLLTSRGVIQVLEKTEVAA